MSLLERVRKSLEKKDVNDEIPSEIVEDEIKSFNFNGIKWILSPFMEDIKKGDFMKIPIECMLTHFIMRNKGNCYYVLFDGEAEYEIYEMDWVGDNFTENGELVEPEYREVSSGMGAVETANYMREKIVDGYDIFIEERKVFESA